MGNTATRKPARYRFGWLDGMKGLAILWIVGFHFIDTHPVVRQYPWVLEPAYLSRMAVTCAGLAPGAWVTYLLKGIVVAVSQLGFHGVGVFLVASGFGLSYSLAKSGGAAEGWLGWYGKRFLRLFPLYWVAHLVYLVSPFVAHAEPTDYRFLLSLLGLRLYPLRMIFFYANPAWWFFTLLIQLYLVFPLLNALLRKLGPYIFLLVCAAVTFALRYVMLCVVPVDGNYIQGGFFGGRLVEFAAGMALGHLAQRDPADVERRFFGPAMLAAGAAMYALGIASYRPPEWLYTFTDALTGIGLFVLLAHLCRRLETAAARVAGVLALVGTYSYGLYLIHQPYVIYFGERLRHLGFAAFIVLGCLLIAALALFSGGIEYGVNRLLSRLTRPRSRPGP